ncbi:MAG: hypothetical protein AB7P03_21110 [Kofleriaceae bacterium]
MGRFEATAEVEIAHLRHSVIELSWGALRGAHGPSDGSAGASSNVPSALAVIRHAQIFAGLPEEIDEAFTVLEGHAMCRGSLYPVAVAITPFLFDCLRRGSPVSDRITHVIAAYVASHRSLEPRLQRQLLDIVIDHAPEIMKWHGRYDRALAAVAIHVPELRAAYVATVATEPTLSAFALLALNELGAASDNAIAFAHQTMEREDADPALRMAAAAFLTHRGEHPPIRHAQICAALPAAAADALSNLVAGLWIPRIDRGAIAPQLQQAEVVFVNDRFVMVHAGSRSITLPWADAAVQRGDLIQVGIDAGGKAAVAVLTDRAGQVTVVDL